MTPERRWIILTEDGGHVTVGRHTDPTEEEISRASAQLRGLGVDGWLAILEGNYHAKGSKLTLMKVRELTSGSKSWDAAAKDFMTRRRRTNAPAQ